MLTVDCPAEPISLLNENDRLSDLGEFERSAETGWSATDDHDGSITHDHLPSKK
jgi:hypothetical protein